MTELQEIKAQLNRIESRQIDLQSIDNIIGLDELCEILHINKTTYYAKWKTLYPFPRYKIGSKLLFNKVEVGNWMAGSLTI